MLNLYKFLNFLFIEECIGCQKNGIMLCEECKLEILNKEKINHKDLENTKSIDWVKSPLLYKNEILKKSIFQLKYYYVKAVAKYLAELVYKDFLNFINEILEKTNQTIENVIIVPIPISKKRLIERNYNQSEVLIKEIIKEIIVFNTAGLAFGQPCRQTKITEENILTDLLQKQKHTIKFSHTHSSYDRENLIKDAFKVNKKYQKDFLQNKIIILFDDITTTGATFYEARKTLIDFGTKRENIFGFALAH